MSAYFMSFILNETDTSWRPDYFEQVPIILARHGAEIIAVGLSPILLEGDMPAPKTFSIIRFPSMQHVEAFMASDDYLPFKEARQRAAETGIVAFEVAD